jgi:septal ring factor EnvC (AmiA/AmiB activator)
MANILRPSSRPRTAEERLAEAVGQQRRELNGIARRGAQSGLSASAAALAQAQEDTAAVDSRVDTIEATVSTLESEVISLESDIEDFYARIDANDASIAANAKGYYSLTGDGSTTAFTITHNRNQELVIVQVYTATTKEMVQTDITLLNNNQISVSFLLAPTAADSYLIVII